MAYLLSGEQQSAAAVSPLRSLLNWVGRLRAERVRRQALLSLLELDDSRLRDLGISRHDLFETLHDPSRNSGAALSQSRASSSHDWLGRS